MSNVITGGNSTKTGQRVDPFPTFKFHVSVDGITTAAFTDCSGLEMSTEVFEYQEGGLNEYTHKFPVRTKLSNVTLKRGFALSNDLFDWYHKMEDDFKMGSKLDLRNVTITLRTTANQQALMRWTLEKAFPIKWVGPSFKSAEAAVAVESLEFAHHGIKIQKE